MRKGGEDTVVEVLARMRGWKVRSYDGIRAGLHLRTTGQAVGGAMKSGIELGLREYSYGSHPLYVLLKCIRRVGERPYLLGSLTRLAGFAGGYFRRTEREVDEEFVRFLRREQMLRLRGFLRHDAL
jgi:hypothetical protein